MFGLALRNIKSSFRGYRSIYALLLVSQLVAVIILFFVYGTITSYNIKKEEKRMGETHIYARFEEHVSVISVREILPEILSQMEDRMEYSFIDITSPYDDLEITCIMEYHNGRYSVPSDPFPDDRLVSGRYIDEEEMNDGSKVAFAYFDKMSIEEGEIFQIGDTCDLFGEKYEIVGVIEGGIHPRVTIPLNSCTEDMKTRWVSVTFYEFPTMSDYNIFKDTITRYYGSNATFNDFEPVELDDFISYNSVIALSLAIGVIAALDTILVYNFLMKKRRKQMAVFGIEGATRIQQIGIWEIEILIITILTTLAGVAIFKIGIEDGLLNVYKIRMSIFNIKVYATMLGAYIGCILVGSGLIVAINIRKKVLDMRRE